jgi:hypothetical protein
MILLRIRMMRQILCGSRSEAMNSFVVHIDLLRSMLVVQVRPVERAPEVEEATSQQRGQSPARKGPGQSLREPQG